MLQRFGVTIQALQGLPGTAMGECHLGRIGRGNGVLHQVVCRRLPIL
jgi:hypothetical protein